MVVAVVVPTQSATKRLPVWTDKVRELAAVAVENPAAASLSSTAATAELVGTQAVAPKYPTLLIARTQVVAVGLVKLVPVDQLASSLPLAPGSTVVWAATVCFLPSTASLVGTLRVEVALARNATRTLLLLSATLLAACVVKAAAVAPVVTALSGRTTQRPNLAPTPVLEVAVAVVKALGSQRKAQLVSW